MRVFTQLLVLERDCSSRSMFGACSSRGAASATPSRTPYGAASKPTLSGDRADRGTAVRRGDRRTIHNDPRPYYFRALRSAAQGRADEARADFMIAAALEIAFARQLPRRPMRSSACRAAIALVLEQFRWHASRRSGPRPSSQRPDRHCRPRRSPSSAPTPAPCGNGSSVPLDRLTHSIRWPSSPAPSPTIGDHGRRGNRQQPVLRRSGRRCASRRTKHRIFRSRRTLKQLLPLKWPNPRSSADDPFAGTDLQRRRSRRQDSIGQANRNRRPRSSSSRLPVPSLDGLRDRLPRSAGPDARPTRRRRLRRHPVTDVQPAASSRRRPVWRPSPLPKNRADAGRSSSAGCRGRTARRRDRRGSLRLNSPRCALLRAYI